VAKGGRFADQRGGGKTIIKYKGKKPELPTNTEESDAGTDKKAHGLFLLMCLFSISLVSIGMLLSVREGIFAFHANPINWFGAVVSLLGVAASVLLARALLWASFLLPIMYASKKKGWQSVEDLCRRALKLWKLIPGGASTAAVMLTQSLLTRGEYDEAVKFAENEWEMHNTDVEYNKSLAPMYSAIGMVLQAKSDFRGSITWNDRAIQAFDNLLAQLKSGKGLMAKLAKAQNNQLVANVQTQLAVSHFNNASSYFNQRNHRAAKDAYRKVLEHINESGDFPEKSDLIHATKEQLARLKHT
jgi:tetratricopeptide (TPR) repeat protein